MSSLGAAPPSDPSPEEIRTATPPAPAEAATPPAPVEAATPPAPGGPATPPALAGPETPPAPADPATPRRRRRRTPGIDLVIAAALGLAAVGGAFAAYRNEQHNHKAAERYSLGVRNFDDAGQYFASGDAAIANDHALFLQYALARRRDRVQAQYIFNTLMSPTLRAGVRWWQGPNAHDPQPAATPFTPADPAYDVPAVDKANELTAKSREDFTLAREEQDKADHFTLVELILATSLLLYGIAGVTRGETLKLGALAFGGLIFVLSVVLLIAG